MTTSVTANRPMDIAAPVLALVERLLAVEDLEHERLGGTGRTAAGEDVDLGVGLEGEDHQHDARNSSVGEIAAR